MMTPQEIAAQTAKIETERQTVEASRAALAARRPADAQALIVAYFATSTKRVVALAWSSHRKDLFAEMRKAAARFADTRHLGPGCDHFTAMVVIDLDFESNGSYYHKGSLSHWHSDVLGDDWRGKEFTTRAEAEAFIAGQAPLEPISFDGTLVPFAWSIRQETIEHREKYSMGHGYYLKASGTYSSGWKVHKTSVDGGYHVVELDVLDGPTAPTPSPRPPAGPASSEAGDLEGVVISYNEAKSGIELRFPAKPDESVRANLKDNGWRWSHFSSCWYHRDTPAARAFAQTIHAAADPHCGCNDCQEAADAAPDDAPPAVLENPITGLQHRVTPGHVETTPDVKVRMAAETAAKLRALADGMDAAIASKIDSAIGRQRLTRRRAHIADGMRQDGERLQRVQTVLRKLADAHEAPELWPGLEAVYADARELRSKAAIEKLAYEGRTYIPARETHTASVLERLAGKTAPDAAAAVRQLERQLIGVKIPGFFPTPAALARDLVAAADVQDGQTILEPSAGKGDLVTAIHQAAPGARVFACESSATLRAIVEARGEATILEAHDCLLLTGQAYDRIVMNPPFEHGQDADHVRHCFDHLLAPGGRLASIVSEAAFARDDRRYGEFRDWMAEYLTNDPQPLEAAFSTAQAFRQTGVRTRIIVLDKPAAARELETPPAIAAPTDDKEPSLFDGF